MNESRKRLIYKGRISGWMREHINPTGMGSVKYDELFISCKYASEDCQAGSENSDMGDVRMWNNIKSHGSPACDEFDVGIEANGEWWFENDIIEDTDNNDRYTLKFGRYNHEVNEYTISSLGWYLDPLKEHEYIMPATYLDDSYKLVGTTRLPFKWPEYKVE